MSLYKLMDLDHFTIEEKYQFILKVKKIMLINKSFNFKRMAQIF